MRQRLDLPAEARVVLCLAALRPHKNQELLVRALPRLPEDVVLVLAGRHEPYAEQVAALARELGVDDRVRMPGYISDADLEGLWRFAACAAFPTRAEGFGAPILEAMARGVSVACSDLPVLREIGGEIPFYFDPAAVMEADAAVIGAIRFAEERGAAGIEHAKRFSWGEAARKTMASYERALAASV